MLSGTNERMFLPFWRGGRLLFITNFTEGTSTRLNYAVAGATEQGGTKITRTWLASMNDAQLTHCQKIADSGPELQKFFAAIGGGNLDHYLEQLDSQALPFPATGSRLIYICLYLDFLRKYAIDEEIIRIYERTPPKERLNLEKSQGIYKILSLRMESKRACALFDADVKFFRPAGQSSLAAANYFRAAAMAKSEMRSFADAEELMLRSVKLHNTEDKWRRLGEFARAHGDKAKSIEYYLTAHEMTPLPAPSLLALSTMLVEEQQVEKAGHYVDLLNAHYPNAAKGLRSKLEAVNLNESR